MTMMKANTWPKIRRPPDCAVVASAILAIQLGHTHNAFGQAWEYLLKACEFFGRRKWCDAQLAVLRNDGLRPALLNLVLLLFLELPKVAVVTSLRQARRRRMLVEAPAVGASHWQ